jgi:hypothetical protein
LIEENKDSKDELVNKKKSASEGPNPLRKAVVENCKEIKVKPRKRRKENQVKEDSYQRDLDVIAPNVDSCNNKTLNNSIESLSSELSDQEISWVKSLAINVDVQGKVKKKKS